MTFLYTWAVGFLIGKQFVFFAEVSFVGWDMELREWGASENLRWTSTVERLYPRTKTIYRNWTASRGDREKWEKNKITGSLLLYVERLRRSGSYSLAGYVSAIRSSNRQQQRALFGLSCLWGCQVGAARNGAGRKSPRLAPGELSLDRPVIRELWFIPRRRIVKKWKKSYIGGGALHTGKK